MINGISLQRLRNSEYLQFITDFLAIVQLNNPASLLVQTQYDDLLAAKNMIENLFKKDLTSVISDELASLDDVRDQVFNGINGLLGGHACSLDPVTKAHANLLMNHIESYGKSIARENYQSETAIINNLLSDWINKPELATAITALNLTTLQTQLTTANTAFNTRYLSRAQEIGAIPADSMKEKRMIANSAYYELRDHLNWNNKTNKGAAPFGKAANDLNALVEQYSRLVTVRKTETVALTA